jgi:hypothetical protein
MRSSLSINVNSDDSWRCPFVLSELVQRISGGCLLPGVRLGDTVCRLVASYGRLRTQSCNQSRVILLARYLGKGCVQKCTHRGTPRVKQTPPTEVSPRRKNFVNRLCVGDLRIRNDDRAEKRRWSLARPLAGARSPSPTSHCGRSI